MYPFCVSVLAPHQLRYAAIACSCLSLLVAAIGCGSALGPDNGGVEAGGEVSTGGTANTPSASPNIVPDVPSAVQDKPSAATDSNEAAQVTIVKPSASLLGAPLALVQNMTSRASPGIVEFALSSNNPLVAAEVYSWVPQALESNVRVYTGLFVSNTAINRTMSALLQHGSYCDDIYAPVLLDQWTGGALYICENGNDVEPFTSGGLVHHAHVLNDGVWTVTTTEVATKKSKTYVPDTSGVTFTGLSIRASSYFYASGTLNPGPSMKEPVYFAQLKYTFQNPLPAIPPLMKFGANDGLSEGSLSADGRTLTFAGAVLRPSGVAAPSASP